VHSYLFQFVPFAKYYYVDQFKEDIMSGACRMHGEDEKCTHYFRSENLRRRNYLGDLGVYERIILK
jgi:hypothetical protein